MGVDHVLLVKKVYQKIWRFRSIYICIYTHHSFSNEYASLILQWDGFVYIWSVWWDLNSSARTIVTTITIMELHSTSILGNSPSSIKNSLTQNTLLIYCQHKNILSLCCSIHHNTFWNSFKTSMELPSSLLYHLIS